MLRVTARDSGASVVFGARHRLQVIRIHAARNATEVIEIQARRDRVLVPFRSCRTPSAEDWPQSQHPLLGSGET